MGAKTKIDWCDSTWNPVTGCLHGCEYCYARRIAERFGGCWRLDLPPDTSWRGNVGVRELMGDYARHSNGKCHVLDEPEIECDVIDPPSGYRGKVKPYPYSFDPTFHRYKLGEPQRWKKPRNIFVCSMADLFGDLVPDEWIAEVFKACEAAPQHRYLFLTKNPARFGSINGWNHRYNNEYAKDNMWFGTTITRQHELNRMLKLPYGNAHTFLSVEPILERIDIDHYLPASDARWRCSYCGHYAITYANHCGSCSRIGGYSGSFRKQPVNWIILGAESGNRKDKVVPRREWIDNIVQICDEHDIPVFMKESLRGLMGSEFRQELPWEAKL